MLDCVCAYALWNGMVRMDTWLACDVWMCAAMRVRARACMHAWHACVLCHLCACARALVYGAHVMGAAPATARDADQAFRCRYQCAHDDAHLRIVVALGDAYVGTRMCMCFVLR